MSLTAHQIDTLRRNGVTIASPEMTHIGAEVDLKQIHGPGVVLHPGTRLRGRRLLILPGAELGAQTPVTVDDCAVGRGVRLHGGYHSGAVYLDDVVVACGAQVRPGTLLEEQANAAHTVGLKQTILLPFVTLGSLVNFCDALMAGGTSRQDHSEVGSSFIHFNFTPFGTRGDKATPSLIGDVPRGVLLRSRRIFLGGQAGLVGPMRVGYGTVLAAGHVYRQDYDDDVLVLGERSMPRTVPFKAECYRRVARRLENNLRYIGNLSALWHWYQRVRLPLALQDPLLQELYGRAAGVIATAISERIQRLEQLAQNMAASIAALESLPGLAQEKSTQRAFLDAWPKIRATLERYPKTGAPDHDGCVAVAAMAARGSDVAYLKFVGGLDSRTVAGVTQWLQAVVDESMSTAPTVSTFN